MPWIRKGECNRCGDCCDARNIDPVQAALMDQALFDIGLRYDSLCQHLDKDKDGRATCMIWSQRSHGCAGFPTLNDTDKVEDFHKKWPRCSYTFEWIK